MAYHSVPHSATGYTPHYLLHGHEMRLPTDIAIPNEIDNSSVEEHLQLLKDRLKTAYSEALRHSALASADQARYRNRGRKMRTFEVGSKVYVHDPAVRPGESKKFYQPWRGPYVILRKTSSVNYEVQLDAERTAVIHVNRLKPCYAPTQAPEAPRNSYQEKCEDYNPPMPQTTHEESDQADDEWIPIESYENVEEAIANAELPFLRPEEGPGDDHRSIESQEEVDWGISEDSLDAATWENDSIEPASSPPDPIDNMREDPTYKTPTNVKRRSPYLLRNRLRSDGGNASSETPDSKASPRAVAEDSDRDEGETQLLEGSLLN